MRYYFHTEDTINYPHLIGALETAFADHCRGLVQMPPKVYVNLVNGDMRTMPAYIPDLDIAGVKIVNVHSGNRARGLPSVMALTIILDPASGLPRAIINATQLTDMRTGAAGAVAAKYLAPKREGIVLGLVGSGRQAGAQLEAISAVYAVEEFRVWSRDPQNAETFVKAYHHIDGAAMDLERVCDCDVLCTTTPSRTPLIRDEWVHEGTHINAIGADAPGKEELDPAILLRSTVVVDDYTQAVHSGEVNVPITAGVFGRERIAGTIGDVVCGNVKRKSPEEITIFDSTGLAIQDLAIASIALEGGEFIELPFP
jgi:alanine dehydrogenase